MSTDNALASLDIKNVNNTIIGNFELDGNPVLICIQVDDLAYRSANSTTIDPRTGFLLNILGLNCFSCRAGIPFFADHKRVLWSINLFISAVFGT